MADADLDVVIRKLSKQQHKVLMAAVKTRRAHYAGLAAKAKTAAAKQHFKQLGNEATEHGTAAAKRLEVSADNAADAYARAMRKAAEAVPVPAKFAPSPKPSKEPARDSIKPPAKKQPRPKAKA